MHEGALFRSQARAAVDQPTGGRAPVISVRAASGLSGCRALDASRQVVKILARSGQRASDGSCGGDDLAVPIGPKQPDQLPNTGRENTERCAHRGDPSTKPSAAPIGPAARPLKACRSVSSGQPCCNAIEQTIAASAASSAMAEV